MRDLRIRFANERDFPRLISLAEEFLPEEVDNEKRMNALKQALRNRGYQLLVADLDGEIVGFVDQWFIDDFTHGAKLSYIQSLFVRSQHRRKGVANKLLQETIRNAKNRGVLEIHISAEIDNKTAISLYKKHGFTKEHIELEREFK